MDPRATLRAERHSARFNLRSRSVFTSTGGETAPTAPRRNSIPTNVETPNKRKIKNKIKNVVSTVSTAAARMPENESIERKRVSRSVTTKEKRMSGTKTRKGTAPRSAAKRGGLEPLPTKERHRKSAA